MSRLIDADTTKVSLTKYFETHIRNLKTKHILLGDILKGQMKEVCTDVCFGIDAQPTVDAVPVQKWIPIKTRPMDDEEREYYSEHFGYDIEYEEAIMFDCEMPKDGQTVWVCYKDGTVAQDVCENDDGMVGLEENGDWDYIVAWMPLDKPEPYKMDGKEQEDG